MGMVTTGAELLGTLEALQQAGIASSAYVGAEYESVVALLKGAGYIEVISDSGVSLGWVKGFSSVIGDIGSTSTVSSIVGGTTATVTETATSTEIAVASSTLLPTATAAASEGAVAALVASPKAIVITGILASLGFVAGFDIGRDLVDKIFFDDQYFDWATDSVGGKIITYLSSDGKTYVSADLVERVKNTLIENGLLDADVSDHDINTNIPIQVPYMSMQQTAQLAYNLLLESCIESGMDLTSDSGQRIYDLENYVNSSFEYWPEYEDTKLGVVELSFGKGGDFTWSTYAHYNYRAVDSDTVKSGHLTYPPDGTGTAIIDAVGKTGRTDWISYSGLNVHEDTTFALDINLTELITLSLSAGEEGGRIVLSNIGRASEVSVPEQQGATLPSRDGTIPTDYPSWNSNAKWVNRPTEEDPNNKEKFLPIILPSPLEPPFSQSDAQSGEATNTQLDEQAQEQTKLQDEYQIPTPTPTDTSGTTPTIATPTSGSSTGLVKIYNPTLSTLVSFSQWLWSNNIFDNFSKLFQDPMQAIIGLNLLYATPSRGTDENIIVGNLDSNISSRTVNNQYIAIDCGTVTINKYFNSVLDYISTTVDCYLPFIGIVQFNTSDVMGKSINIKANIDVLTGTILYNIFVGTQLLYTYNGNCAVQLPLSSANYSSVITSAIGLAGGIGAAIASGGTLAPLAIAGAANMAGNMKHQVERSGNISGNAGAMGVKKPYLIITRNKPYNPNIYNKYYGYPSNTLIQNLSSLSGYTRVKDIRIHGINATSNELNEIETLLKGGVIL